MASRPNNGEGRQPLPDPWADRDDAPFRTPEQERAEAADIVAQLRARRDAGPPPVDAKTVYLERPACDRGCTACQLRCAMNGVMLNWWEKELVRLGGSPNDPVLEHAGVIYAGAVGNA